VHPGVEVSEVIAGVSWDLQVSPNLAVTLPPTVEEARITRILDSGKIYTGAGLKDLTFEGYCQMLEDSLCALGGSS